MEITKLKYLEQLLYLDGGLITSLRMGKGFKKDKFEKVCSVLKELADEWAGNDLIPKYGAHILFELYPAMSSGTAFYNDDEIRSIEDASDVIYEIILNCIGTEVNNI